MMNSDNIVQFLKEHPLINVNALERECNLAQGVISKALNGKRTIAGSSVPAIIAVLESYGLKKKKN